MSNITCKEDNGVAIGSLGQYPEDITIKGIVIPDAKVCPNSDVPAVPCSA